MLDALRMLTWEAIVFRVVFTVLIGGIIGLERGFKNQPVGSRTYMLVSLGACLVMMTNQYIYQEFGAGDVSRLGAQVVSGIGFLGAGTILVTRNNQIRGLTTAAGLWSSACIGLAIGIGFYEGALAVGSSLLLIMTAFRKIDHYVRTKSKYLRVYINFNSSNSMNHFMEECRATDIKVLDMELSKAKGSSKGEVVAFLTIKNPKPCGHAEIISSFAGFEGIKYIEEL